MGLLDDLMKAGLSNITGSSGAQQQSGMNLATGVLEMLGGQQGGLQGLVQAFAQKGLGNIVSSWVSTGPNLPVSGDQLQHALGSNTIGSLAQKAGLAPDAANSMLTQMLPMIVDKLTPEGKIPEGGGLLEQGLNILKGKLL